MSRRAYDNSLRAEQAELTRKRILDAAVSLLGETGDISTAQVAGQAGVSEPTVYRHFPNREALITAAGEYAGTKLGAPPQAPEVGEVASHAVAMALYMGRNQVWIRAGMRNPELREARMSGRRRRLAELKKLLEPSLANLTEHDREVAFAAFAVTQRGETWDHLTATHGLSDEDAGRAVAFILEACVEKLAKLQRQNKTTIIEPAVVKRGRELDAAAVARNKGRGE